MQQMTDLYVARLRALRAVDEMLEALGESCLTQQQGLQAAGCPGQRQGCWVGGAGGILLTGIASQASQALRVPSHRHYVCQAISQVAWGTGRIWYG